MKKFSPVMYAQSECCGRTFKAERVFFANYAFVNNKYAKGRKVNLSEKPYLEALIVLFVCFFVHGIGVQHKHH